MSPLLRLCVSGGLAYCSYAMCRLPLLPLYARVLGATPQMVGLVVGASTMTGVLVKLPAGALSDVFGRKTLLLIGAAVYAFVPFAYLPVAALGWLIAIRFVHGSASAIFGPVAYATLSDLAQPGQRGRWLATFGTVQGVGQATGPVIAGYLMAGGDFDRTFLVSGILGLCALALLWGWSHDPPHHDAAAWWRQAAAGVREVMSDRRILTVSLAQAGQFFVNGTVSAFVPLFAHEVLSLPAPQIGILFGIQTVTTVLARPLAGTFSDRVGRRPLVFSGLLMCATALAGVSLATGFWSLAACTSLYGAAVAVTHSAASAFVTDLARQARYGAAHGVFGTIYDIGDAAGPLAGGFLVAAAGYEITFRFVALAVAILSLVFFVVSRGWSAPGAWSPAPGP
jgi:DHA1 family multidrug resistance protein-like MFS transporter